MSRPGDTIVIDQFPLSLRQTLNMSPAGTPQMIYDAWDHLPAETDGAGHVVKQYVWAGDEPVAVLDGTANAASPVLYSVHADRLQRPELSVSVRQESDHFEEFRTPPVGSRFGEA